MLGVEIHPIPGTDIPEWRYIDQMQLQDYGLTATAKTFDLPPHPEGEPPEALAKGITPEVYADWLAKTLIASGWCY